MTRRINAAGLALVKQWEGVRLTAYTDVGGVLTIGYGHTSVAGSPKVFAGMTIGDTEAEKILINDLAKSEAIVSSVVRVPVNDNQFAVLVSFEFNTGKLAQSTLLKRLNKGDYAAVPGELVKWVNAGGKRVQGLVNRRAAEAGLWAKGEFVSSNNVTATTRADKADIATVGSVGTVGAVATITPAIPELTKAVTDQQDELSSGEWVRVAIAAVILGLTIWGVYRKFRS